MITNLSLRYLFFGIQFQYVQRAEKGCPAFL